MLDGATRHVVAYWGGTAFNWVASRTTYITPERPDSFWFNHYIQSAERFRTLAKNAGADVILSNHTIFDGSKTKLPALATRKPGSASVCRWCRFCRALPDGRRGVREGGHASDQMTLCLNCGDELRGHFCAACGQRSVPANPTVAEFAGDVWQELSGYDGRIAATFRNLLRPGRLTVDYLQGRRARYAAGPPLSHPEPDLPSPQQRRPSGERRRLRARADCASMFANTERRGDGDPEDRAEILKQLDSTRGSCGRC